MLDPSDRHSPADEGRTRQGRGPLVTASRFRPAWWARNRHVQTAYQSLLRRRPSPAIRPERLELDDGDFLDLCWAGPQDGPIVILLHGLEGSIDSKYIRGQMRSLRDAGLRSVLVHFRGCSGEPNRLRRGYHSGVSEDLERVIRALRRREPNTPLAAIGYSLGGNVLLKWLGEKARHSELETAVAVSVPFRLALCARTISQGTSRLYNHYLIRRMRQSYGEKFRDRSDAPFPVSSLHRLKNFHDFDNAITAPLHGFESAEDYYQRCSSIHFLHAIRTPTLIIHALDDPFMTPATVPTESELSDAIHLELSKRGGHVGFVAGNWPWRPRWWLEERISSHVKEHLARLEHNRAA